MQPVHSQKNTPNRRRPAAGRRNTPQKTYASENDIPNLRREQLGSPSTPQKQDSGAIAARATSTAQKQRNKGNKNRHKNGASSPGHAKHDRDSPSFLSQDPSIPVFAGSTFHASPAPSALPIPSFLGFTNGGSPAPKSNSTPTQEPSPPSTDSEEATPPPAEPVERNEDSPLDFFFRADRAEKERSRRASSANTGSLFAAPFSPPHESSKECFSLPRTSQNSLRRPDFSQRNSSSGIPEDELNGSTGQPFGPAFSTPYQERMRAARSNQSTAQSTPVAARDQAYDPSEALKRYLFTGKLGPAPHQQQSGNHQSPVSTQQRTPPQVPAQEPPKPHHGYNSPQLPLRQQVPQHHQSQPTLPRGMFPASVLASHGPLVQKATPAAPVHLSPAVRPDQITAMEGDLRRILKLDSSG
ncbi:hypothetical protein F5Y15DRAFT_142088 [Xylariaceae sp. FL0016]|nr:hypothetical protein F5Y15DRAFT_142088 [Xylariaceae sp. FL0016]